MKSCFIICPIGKRKTKTRKNADLLRNLIIKPVAIPLGYEVDRADLLAEHHSSVTESISEHIFNDDLVIADLTDSNPNVVYELGKRHAWGGNCIHLTDDPSKLPFDIIHQRVITYLPDESENHEEVRTKLRLAIKNFESTPAQPPYPLTPERIIDLTGATVLIETVGGRRDHYYLAERVAKKECKKIFLMQRSSSLILGPEQGWGAEKIFYKTLLKKIGEGAEFFHIVSLEGIARHLERPQSVFPEAKTAIAQLSGDDDCISIQGPKSEFYFKRIPDVEEDRDLKPDRQARTFLIEYDNGECEGVVVVDLGGRQSCFHFKGPIIRQFFAYCVDFYHECTLLKRTEVESILEKYISPLTFRST